MHIAQLKILKVWIQQLSLTSISFERQAFLSESDRFIHKSCYKEHCKFFTLVNFKPWKENVHPPRIYFPSGLRRGGGRLTRQTSGKEKTLSRNES